MSAKFEKRPKKKKCLAELFDMEYSKRTNRIKQDEAGCKKGCWMHYTNISGSDQPLHPHNLSLCSSMSPLNQIYAVCRFYLIVAPLSQGLPGSLQDLSTFSKDFSFETGQFQLNFIRSIQIHVFKFNPYKILEVKVIW